MDREEGGGIDFEIPHGSSGARNRSACEAINLSRIPATPCSTD